MTVYLDFALGPVQLFVAQSRRTRDLWGSSYLLSFLSAHAVKAAIDAGGTPARPNFDVDREELLLWICGRGGDEKPLIGSIPNHFIMKAKDPAHARSLADAAQKAIAAAWKQVCAVVWDAYVETVHTRGQGTRQIWHRQLDELWEIAWIVAPTEPGLIRRRKHWRTHRLPDEPGDKCMVMPDFQELSGHVRARGPKAREQQLAFWKALREGGRIGPLDLRDGERLSAVALVKRLFPRVAQEALGWSLDTSHWPSTVYVAALPWIRKVASSHPQVASRYADAVIKLAPDVATKEQPKLAGPQCRAAGAFARLDANFFHATFIEDPRLCPLTGTADESDQARRAELIDQLKSIRATIGEPPSSFYALLLADGDRLGKLVGELGGTRVGDALRAFTGEVQEIVSSCDGVTIYAGGDDVLAMLPVDLALECARRLADRYEHAFDPKVGATLSAAVCFAHIRMPLRSVLRESHRLLDEVAKRDNGRASLAVGVLKRGGLHCEWTTTWTRYGADAVERISQLAKHLGGNDDEVGFSSSLLYRLHATLGLLCDWPQWRPGMWATALAGLDLQTFVAAEVQRSLSDQRDDDDGLEQATNEITSVLVNLIPKSRNAGSPDSTPGLGVDALLLARFLATKGSEEVSA